MSLCKLVEPSSNGMDPGYSETAYSTVTAVPALPKHATKPTRSGEGETESTIEMLKRHHSMAPQIQVVHLMLTKDEQCKSSAVCRSPSRLSASGQWASFLASINSVLVSKQGRRRQQSISELRIYRGRQEISRRYGNRDDV